MNNQPAAPEAASRPTVMVIFGGRSNEHSISCVSAGSIIEAVDPHRYRLVVVGIRRDGCWVLQDTDADRYHIGPGGELPQVEGEQEVHLDAHGHLWRIDGQHRTDLGNIDVVFPVLHGPWGQDGTLQGQLELAQMAYVGAGVLTSAVGTDKEFMKRLLQAHTIPLMPWKVVRPGQWEQDPQQVATDIGELGYPVFVKPARAGSSFGISRVNRPDELEEAISNAIAHDPKVIIEAAAPSPRELEIGVLEAVGGGEPEVSVVAEIIVSSGHSFYDFEAKYLPEHNTELAVPATVDSTTCATIEKLARKAFTALGVEGLARVDFFLLPDGQVIFNEIETMPGFTATSMFPRMWAASGLSYSELVDRLLQQALRRSRGLR